MQELILLPKIFAFTHNLYFVDFKLDFTCLYPQFQLRTKKIQKNFEAFPLLRYYQIPHIIKNFRRNKFERLIYQNLQSSRLDLMVLVDISLGRISICIYILFIHDSLHDNQTNNSVRKASAVCIYRQAIKKKKRFAKRVFSIKNYQTVENKLGHQVQIQTVTGTSRTLYFIVIIIIGTLSI